MAALDFQYIAEIVSHAMLGDSNAFAELYAATYQQQFRFAWHYLQDEYLAQDALQETYILALKNLHTLKNPELFISWLNQICFRVCFSMQKKQSRYSSELSNYHQYSDSDIVSDASLEAQVIQVDEKEYVMRQILSLPFTESQVIIMRYYRNMTIQDIATLLDISRSSVKRYLERGRLRLRDLLEY